MNEDKDYVNSIIIKELVFPNGGTSLKVSIRTQELKDHLDKIDNNGWSNLIISKRKQKKDNGVSHYAYVDQFKPDSSYLNKEHNSNQESIEDDDSPF